MNAKTSFLGPVNQLPPEGRDLDLPDPHNSTPNDLCAALFSNSPLLFDVSNDGVLMSINPQSREVFQRFDVTGENENEAPTIRWQEQAVDIQLQACMGGPRSFSSLSDASEPSDYVRRFLEVLRSSLDDPALGHDGPKLPVIRWSAGEDGASAQIQLLGIFLAEDGPIDHGDFVQNRLIFEDPEIEARGVREIITALTLIGITLGPISNAEAGLFKKIKAKKQMRIAQIDYQRNIVVTKAPVQPVQRIGYRDVHQDHFINHALLESRSEVGEKKVIVDVANQRAYLIIDGQIAINTAVSTARTGKETPRGTYKITQRVAQGKTSTIYGCDLPYWQRLDGTAIGLHVGDLPGYPASAGCIRLPESVAPTLFTHTESGIVVEVLDHWDQRELHFSEPSDELIATQSLPQEGNS